MILNEPQDYWIELLEGGSYRLRGTSGPCTFSKPATARGVAKLYTLSDGNALIYVGVAQQPMSARLNFGFNAQGKSGYYGYKWKELRQPLRLTVWTAQSGTDHASIREFETVEAEVAFLCRQRAGQWPAYQHEIHFYLSQQAHREAAERIYGHATAGQEGAGASFKR